ARLIEGGPLSYFLIRPDNFREGVGYPLIVLLHGFGASMYDLAGLCPAIDSTGYMYACPNAPYALDIGGGQMGYSWSTGRPGMPDLAEQGPTAEERLAAFMDEVTAEAGTEPGHVLLAGFSQGGGLTLRFGLPRPDAFAGLVVMSGAFRGDDAFREALPPARDIPIFISHGLYDPMVTVQRGQETLTFLEGAGYKPEYHEYEMAHEISEEVIYDLKPWVRSTLPALA
ncbi:MAG TPA: alpha/beta fold hydrolase, partial [Dehalococcoidia bacterium]